MRHSFKVMHNELYAVKVRISPGWARGVGEKIPHESQKVKKNGDGSLELSFKVAGLDEINRRILSFGPEFQVLEDRRDCYWLYIVTNCKEEPKLQEPVKDPARLKWHEVKKVDHYYLSVDALIQPMQIREDLLPYEEKKIKE